MLSVRISSFRLRRSAPELDVRHILSAKALTIAFITAEAKTP